MEDDPTHKPWPCPCCTIPCCCIKKRAMADYQYYARWNIISNQTETQNMDTAEDDWSDDMVSLYDKLGFDSFGGAVISVIVEYLTAMNIQMMDESDEDFMRMIHQKVMEKRANPKTSIEADLKKEIKEKLNELKKEDVGRVCRLISFRVHAMANRKGDHMTDAD
eukprot:99646_1